MSEADNIDFLIIGAQKAGTTSLFRYLSEHPGIYMPGEKEVEFFNDDSKFAHGKEWYYRNYFSRAEPFLTKGEASTHYMMHDCVPGRVRSYYPGIKLIASLRNPIDRAYSHYRMSIRRGAETRTFEQCISDSLASPRLANIEINESREYVFFGEYGRILENYLGCFDRSQLHVVFSENLLSKPAEIVKELYEFLEVDSTFVPKNINKQYHISGKQRFPGLPKRLRRYWEWLQKKKWANRLLWRVDFEGFLFWMNTQFNVKPEKGQGPSKEIRAALARYYADDVKLLERLLGVSTPWPDFIDYPGRRSLSFRSTDSDSPGE